MILRIVNKHGKNDKISDQIRLNKIMKKMNCIYLIKLFIWIDLNGMWSGMILNISISESNVFATTIMVLIYNTCAAK